MPRELYQFIGVMNFLLVPVWRVLNCPVAKLQSAIELEVSRAVTKDAENGSLLFYTVRKNKVVIHVELPPTIDT